MVLFFKNQSIIIKRPHNIGGIKYAYSATFTSYPTDIQPASSTRTTEVDGRIGKIYTAYIDATIDVKESDVIVTEDGKKYSVKSVSKWSGAGLLDHIELTIESQD